VVAGERAEGAGHRQHVRRCLCCGSAEGEDVGMWLEDAGSEDDKNCAACVRGGENSVTPVELFYLASSDRLPPLRSDVELEAVEVWLRSLQVRCVKLEGWAMACWRRE